MIDVKESYIPLSMSYYMCKCRKGRARVPYTRL